MSDELTREQREEARWRILRALDAGRPVPVTETILWRALHDLRLPISMSGIRRELDYLEHRQLVRIEDRTAEVWTAELTWHGVDLVEYAVPCASGIARPPRD